MFIRADQASGKPGISWVAEIYHFTFELSCAMLENNNEMGEEGGGGGVSNIMRKIAGSHLS